MQRICIMGSPGSGKSTFAKKLGQKLDIEVVHMDQLFWEPGWISVTREQLELNQAKHLIKKKWIIDGTYSSVWKPRIEHADTIIFLDFSRWICLYRIFKRYCQHRTTARPDMREGCPEKIDIEFIRYLWSYSKEKRDKVLNMLSEQKQDKKVFILRNRNEVADFLAN